MRFIKIVSILVSFVLTTGFLPFTALLGPGITVATSGNIYKAGAQFLIDQQIKNKTGKNSFAYVKEEVVKQNKKENFDADLIELIETRVKIVHTKIAKQNEEYNSNKDFIQLVERRIKIVRKKLDIIKINQ
ncbi:hypothetical protein OAU30_00540 [Candidatus Pelagibacter sp.]|nr:hypothetical protein [Candidatus Pelagibacter sp.]